MDIARFLKNIMDIESSGGKDVDHRIITSGIHKGDAAQGKYGLMPNTIEELKSRYGKDLNEDELATKLAERLLTKTGGDEPLAAAMWNQGHNSLSGVYPENDERFNARIDKLKQNINYKKYPKEPPKEKYNLIKELMKGLK
jgi:hypothetical protein